MAIAFDDFSTIQSNNTGTSVSWTHTCSGSERAIFVCSSNTSQSAVTGVTYGGVALSNVFSEQEGATGKRCSMWKLSNPTTGSNTVVVSFSAGVAGVFAAVSFTGCIQTTSSLTGTPATNTGADATPTVNVSSVAGDVVLDVVVFTETLTISAGAGQTQRWNTVGSFAAGAGSTEAGGGTITMSWSLSGAGNWAIGGAAIKAAATSAEAQDGQTITSEVPFWPKDRTPYIACGFMCEEGLIIPPTMPHGRIHDTLPDLPPFPALLMNGFLADPLSEDGEPPPDPIPTETGQIQPRISLVPQAQSDEAQWKRQVAAWQTEANQGHLANTGIITLAANASSTLVNDDRVGIDSYIGFMPRTANAASEISNGTLYVTTGKQTFTITHANNSQTDRTFVYSILG